MIGSHVRKFWSSTQASLALSSGEAEYFRIVRAAGMGLGQQALFRDAWSGSTLLHLDRQLCGNGDISQTMSGQTETPRVPHPLAATAVT